MKALTSQQVRKLSESMKSAFEDYAQTYGGLHHIGALTDSAEKNTTLIRKCGAEFVRILDGETDWQEDLPELREDLFNLIEKGCPKLDLIDLSFACTRGRTRAISDTLKSIGLADPSLRVLAQLCHLVPADLNTEGFDTMPYLDMDTMVWFAGRWWGFPTASTDLDSAEFEWRDNGLYLLQPNGDPVEGILFVGEVELD